MAQASGRYDGIPLSVLEKLIAFELGEVISTTAITLTKFPKWLIRLKLNERQNQFARESRCNKKSALICMTAERSLYRLPSNCMDGGLIAARYYTDEDEYEDLDLRDQAFLDANYEGWKVADSADCPELIYPDETAGNIPMIGIYPKPESSGTLYTGTSDTGISIITSLPTTQTNITGTVTSDHASTLTDSATTFTSYGLLAGMYARNITDGSYGIITTVGANTLAISAGLDGGTADTWTTGDLYAVLAGEYMALIGSQQERFIFGYDFGCLADITVPADHLWIDYVPYPTPFRFDETAADSSQANAYQYPDIPRGYHHALVFGVVADLLRTFREGTKEFERSNTYEALWAAEVAKAKAAKAARPYEEKPTQIVPRFR
jgi:hypothetical protein